MSQHIALGQQIKGPSSHSSLDIGKDELEPFLDKEYRDAYLDGHVKGKVAYQIQALREALGLSQKEFGDLIGKPQSVVSRLENTEFGAVTINTLLEIASKLKMALQVQFVDYPTMLSEDVGSHSLRVENIDENYKAPT